MAIHIRRRDFITLLGGAAATSIAGSLPLRAQPQPRMLRVGFVGIQPREFYGAFLERMAELGYQEGGNFTFEYIPTPNIEGYETSYRELAARKVDVFLAVGNEPALVAARSASQGAPKRICGELISSRRQYYRHFRTPGRARRKTRRARSRSVSGRFCCRDRIRPGFARATRCGDRSARKLGLEPRMIEVKGQQDYDGAFAAMDDLRGQPLILPAGPMFLRDREAIAQILLARRIPLIASFRENNEAGALMSYGFDLIGLFR